MTPPMERNGHSPLADQPIGDLLSRFAEDSSTLVGQEIALAKAEIARQVGRAATVASFFGGAVALALAALGALTAAAVLGLSLVVDAWLAALIVGGGLLVLAAAAALTAKERLEDVARLPTEAVEGIQEDAAEVAEGIREGREDARREREVEEVRNG
jgi:ABC-type multidrug transport system fused ATPase/permease subunit